MITVQEVLKRSERYLEDKQVPKARRQAEEILSLSLKKARIDLYTHFDQPVEEKELQQIRENLSRRAKREPLQYIEGQVEFYSGTFKVNPHVLIPRQETEILVDQITQYLKTQPLSGKILWDLCCGSGCIGISLKKIFPELRVILSDLSKEALSMARENARLNQVEVEFFEGDLMEAFSENIDYLASNPPYIASCEIEKLDPEVLLYEPKMSLEGGKDGLDFYKKILAELPKRLNPQGKAWFEIGFDQKEALEDLSKSKYNFKTEFKKDYAGHDRFFFLELE